MSVVAVIGTAVAAQIGDTDDEAVRTQDLRVEPAHAERFRIKRGLRESRRSCTQRITQSPHANHRCGFRFAGRTGFIQRGDGYRHGSIRLAVIVKYPTSP